VPEALSQAREAGLDLVEVAPTDSPPVCRIMDYGKWRYNQKKRDHKAKTKQHQVILKEVRLRPKTEEHDQFFKLKKAREFLEKGNRVQVTMLFRGRELAHKDLALNTFNEISQQMQDICKVEVAPKQQGRRMVMILAPDKQAAVKK